MNRISIDERLKRLRQDQLSDRDVATHVINAMVDTPLRDVLVSEANLARFGECLGISEEEAAGMTYGQAAVRIHDMAASGNPARKKHAYDAMYLLTRPFRAEVARRRKREEDKP